MTSARFGDPFSAHRYKDIGERLSQATLAHREHLDAYATAYRYPSPRGRVKAAPTPAEIDQDIVKIDDALLEIAARFAIDRSKLDGPAGKSDPIR